MSASQEPPRLVDALYEAALAPDLWPAVLEQIAAKLGGDGACLSRLDLQDGRGPCLSKSMDPAWLTRYEEHFRLVNPFLPSSPKDFVANWRLMILTDEDKLGPGELNRTEFFNDFMRPQGIGGVLFVRVGLSGNTATTLSIHRPLRGTEFTECQRARANALQSHLVRALELTQRIASLGSARRNLTEMIATSVQAVFIVEADGEIRHASAPAERLLTASRGLRSVSGRLTASDPAAAARLAAHIAAAAAPRSSPKPAGSLFLRGPESAAPLLLNISPARTERTDIFAEAPAVLVCVSDPHRRAHVPPQKLIDLFALTPSEARVAAALSAGRPVRGIADDLGLSANTIRVHLSRIFEKTGAHRQTDLAAMLASLTS